MRGSLGILAALLLLASCSRPPTGVKTPGSVTAARPGGTVVDYEVRLDDSWAAISETFFGTSREAARLARENGSDPALAPDPGRVVKVSVPSDELETVRQIAEARGPYNSGVDLMQQAGRDAEAADAFERALKKAPHFVDARYNLGLVLLRMGEPARAESHLQRVVGERGQDKDARYALAASRFHQGRYEQALPELDAALALDPLFLRAMYTRALCLERLGRMEEARRAWRAYLERDDSSAWAEEARSHLGQLP